MDFLAATTSAAAEKMDWADFAWIAFSAAIFVFLLRRLQQVGGRVDVSNFGSPENWLALILGTWFLIQGIAVFLNAEPTAKTQFSLRDLLAGVGVTIIFTLAVILSLKRKGRSLDQLFGFNRQPIWKALAFALVFMFASYPVVSLGAALTQGFSKGPEDLQELVKFFRETGRGQERMAVIFSAVVIAPIAEELFFRGLIYGVAKRYGGMLAAIIFNAAFFAFIHGSLPVFGGLFALAVCLTLAYEFSGSLYVPIFMHAAFNAAELVVMLLGPKTGAGP